MNIKFKHPFIGIPPYQFYDYEPTLLPIPDLPNRELQFLGYRSGWNPEDIVVP